MSLDVAPDSAPMLRTAAEGAGYVIMSLLAGVGGSLAERRRRRRSEASTGDAAGALRARVEELEEEVGTLRDQLAALARDLVTYRDRTAEILREAADAAAKRDSAISQDLEEVLKHAHDASTQIAYLRGRFDERRPPGT